MTSRNPRPTARVSSSPVVPFPQIRLSEVAAAARGELRGDGNVLVRDAVYLSTHVRPDTLFFCVPGAHTDGHHFAGDAVHAGASGLVVERWLDVGAPQLLVGSVREAMGPISAAVFGRPADAMLMVGVTGTNGKTTATFLLESVFLSAGMTPGLIGTTGARIAGVELPLARTTPEAPDLHRILYEMRSAGVRAVAMEVSSHALHQHRVGGVRFDRAVFMNLSQDHLDYHGDMPSYYAAKLRLFTPESSASAVVNVDDDHGRELAESCPIPCVTFGLTEAADIRATDVAADASGVSFRVGRVEVRSALRGLFNVSNCLAVLAVSRSMGIDDAFAVAGIATLPGVPGRVETIEEGQDFLVMVDYAHTPDSIDNVLRAARPLASGRLIVVFGCGGDRDRGKRPLMGRAATSIADLAVITSDNPRSEDPLAIIADVELGAKEGGGSYVVEPDRRTAIRLAVHEASSGDVVVIAGKGHEPYQELAGRTVRFDDREVAAEELRAIQEGA